MEYSSIKNELVINTIDNQVVFNGDIFYYTETENGFVFGDFTAVMKNDTIVLNKTDVLIGSDVFIIKRDSYVNLYANKKKISFEGVIYPVKSVNTIGSSIVYVCDAGELEISNNIRRKSKWNGVSISKLKK